MAQNVKGFCHTLYFRNHTSYDLHLWCTCIYKRIISPSIFFFFQYIWFLGSLGWGVVKGQKMAQNEKKKNLSHSVSQETYIIWLWFLVHMCKWWYLQQIYSFFAKTAKHDLKLPISVCFALYLRNRRSYHQDFDSDIHRCFSLF